MDEVTSYEVKNLCNLMDAIFSEPVSENTRIAKIRKKKCCGCKVDHPSKRRHDCFMLTLEESWTTYSFDTMEQVIQQEILWKLFNEAICVKKLDYYEAVIEHYENLTKNHETTLEFLKALRYNFKINLFWFICITGTKINVHKTLLKNNTYDY